MSTQVLIQSISEICLPKINLRKILIFGFILIISLVIFYIFQISEVTKASFFVSRYEQEIPALSQQNKDLEIRIFQGKSLANTEAILKKFNYERVSKVYYVQVIDSGIAIKH